MGKLVPTIVILLQVLHPDVSMDDAAGFVKPPVIRLYEVGKVRFNEIQQGIGVKGVTVE